MELARLHCYCISVSSRSRFVDTVIRAIKPQLEGIMVFLLWEVGGQQWVTNDKIELLMVLWFLGLFTAREKKIEKRKNKTIIIEKGVLFSHLIFTYVKHRCIADTFLLFFYRISNTYYNIYIFFFFF